ncbi:UNVERIFIED_CONTAM: hypothetical protein FKN15_006874 [Acipenser sinensis]
MRDLRNGVKLKKVQEQQFDLLPTEFELTPFEMLMQDIRAHNFKLRKVTVDGSITKRVKKDAHELILDFIRSRPPLKPESVRKAADLTLKTLSKVCVRMCEPSSAAAQRTVAVLLPCLLEKGIMSNVSEVRALSIQTLVKISKSAGTRLKPHAPRLIPALLESLTVLEPQVLNYLSLRATLAGVINCVRATSS